MTENENFQTRADAAAWISDIGGSLGGIVVLKHWTEYGPTYVRRCVGKVTSPLIREAVALLGWEEDMWGFPALDSILGTTEHIFADESIIDGEPKFGTRPGWL